MAAIPDVKTCVTCRWVVLYPAEPWTCGHMAARVKSRLNLVTGNSTEAYQISCDFFRQETPGYCGPEGYFWEARK